MGKPLGNSTVYIIEDGASVSKKNNQLFVTVGNQDIVKIPMKSIASVVLFGPVQITTQAILALSQEDVAISFHTKRGQFRAYCSPAYSKNIFLRISLYDLSRDKEFCLNFSKSIVSAKIKNGIELLQRYHLSGRSDFHLTDRRSFDNILRKIENVETVESLLGFEGTGADLYFKSFKKCFSNTNLFKGRKYFPSPDPVNASLSFGYSMLSREIQSLLIAHGIDPYIGFYHKLSYGRASLALDLVEEYRHIVIDRLILKMFNKNIFDEEDFEESDGGCYLKRGNLKRFIEHYEEHLGKTAHWHLGKLKSYREIIRHGLESFKSSVASQSGYTPYLYQAKNMKQDNEQ